MNYPYIDRKLEKAKSKKESLETRCKLYNEAASIEEYLIERDIRGLNLPWYKDQCIMYYYMHQFKWLRNAISGVVSCIPTILVFVLFQFFVGPAVFPPIDGKLEDTSLIFFHGIFSLAISASVMAVFLLTISEHLKKFVKPVEDSMHKNRYSHNESIITITKSLYV